MTFRGAQKLPSLLFAPLSLACHGPTTPTRMAFSAPSRLMSSALVGFLLGSLAIVAQGATVVVEAVKPGTVAPLTRGLSEEGPRARHLLDPQAFRIGMEASEPSAKSAKGAPIVAPPEVEETPRWRIRLDYFRGTSDGFGTLFTGKIDTVEQDGLSLGVGYVLVDRLWDLPFNIIVQGAVMWHDEKGYQDNFAQYTVSFKGEWTAFPWNNYLRTRLGFASGWSYASRIPFAEVENRDSKSSKHFLHYLEPSLSFNCGDLYRLLQLDHLFRNDGMLLDNTWIVGSIPHRSGAWGTYGSDNEGDSISGASNYLAIGLQTEF